MWPSSAENSRRHFQAQDSTNARQAALVQRDEALTELRDGVVPRPRRDRWDTEFADECTTDAVLPGVEVARRKERCIGTSAFSKRRDVRDERRRPARHRFQWGQAEPL